jgi:hypothetical protein
LGVRPLYDANRRHVPIPSTGEDQDRIIFPDEYLIIDRVDPDTKIRAHHLRMGTLDDPNRWLFAIGSAPEEQDGLRKRIGHHDLIVDFVVMEVMRSAG